VQFHFRHMIVLTEYHEGSYREANIWRLVARASEGQDVRHQKTGGLERSSMGRSLLRPGCCITAAGDAVIPYPRLPRVTRWHHRGKASARLTD
jgi:hypothetical protein